MSEFRFSHVSLQVDWFVFTKSSLLLPFLKVPTVILEFHRLQVGEKKLAATCGDRSSEAAEGAAEVVHIRKGTKARLPL